MKYKNTDKPLPLAVLAAMGEEPIHFNRYHGFPDDFTERDYLNLLGVKQNEYADYSKYLNWCETVNSELFQVLS